MSLDFTNLKPTGIQKSTWKMFQHNLGAMAIQTARSYVENNYYKLGSLYGFASVALKGVELWNAFERQTAIHQIGKDTYPDFQDLHQLTRPELVTGMRALSMAAPIVNDFSWHHFEGFGSNGIEQVESAADKANMGLQVVNIGATARSSITGIGDALRSLSFSSPRDAIVKGAIHFVNIYRLVSEFSANRYPG